MNRRQQVVLFLVVVALMMTWLFPHWIPRYKEEFRPQVATVVTAAVDDRSPFQKFCDHFLNFRGYSFLFTQEGSGLKIDWGRLFLTDLMIATLGISLVYVLRSRS
jgi:hypothetical protein